MKTILVVERTNKECNCAITDPPGEPWLQMSYVGGPCLHGSIVRLATPSDLAEGLGLIEDLEVVDCEECYGHGSHTQPDPDGDEHTWDCPYCLGTGKRIQRKGEQQ